MTNGGRIRRTIDRTPDTPERIEMRYRQAALLEQAQREFQERYPVLTAENAHEAVCWQKARVEELMKTLVDF